MVTFLTIALMLGVAGLFFHMLAAVDKTRIDKLEKDRKKKEDALVGEDPRKVFSKNWDANIPRPRICPCCGAYLKKEEYLFAAISQYVNSEGKKQASIYGCRYCYVNIPKDEPSIAMVGGDGSEPLPANQPQENFEF